MILAKQAAPVTITTHIISGHKHGDLQLGVAEGLGEAQGGDDLVQPAELLLVEGSHKVGEALGLGAA